MNMARLTVVGVTAALMGCAGTAGDTAAEGDILTGAEEYGTLSSELSSGVALGSTLRTNANLNLRTSASMTAQIRMVIPAGSTVTTVNVSQPNGGWYNVKYNGVAGWSYGSYLNLVSEPSTGGTPSPTSTGADGAIARAKGGVGFSYWWGHGRWVEGGATSSNKGVCTGSCPNCSHSGGYGADCSGYVAKVWQIPSSNTDTTVDSHPYSTATFVGSDSQWSTVARGDAKKGDAFVYNQNGAGHMFIYEAGDAWGSLWAYEARGCSYGVVYNLRTVSSAFKVIRRAGY